MALTDQRKHIVIVGAGAAGMACASTLAQHPEKFKVTMIERMGVTGGQATSISLDKDKFGTDWMNNGVQGGSPIFKHTCEFFKRYGHEAQGIKLQVAFGKGKDGFWTNCFPSHLVERFSSDIKKFGKVLKIIKWTMPVIGVIPIRIMLKMFFFSKDFGDKMVYPLIALFLGTGNQTANVSCAILERLFDDKNMKLWDYDPDTLLPNLPQMLTFPNLHNFYEDWRKDLESKGVDIRLKTDVTEIIQRDAKGVVMSTRPFDPDANDRKGEHTGPISKTETFGELVMCVLADDALKILGRTATLKEKFVLGGAR
ncbi:50f5661f-7f20-4b5a-9adb-400bbf247e8f [Sclerotinia trifoliorum]|uniref:50f5661f-7f20-4b5a-9adb-400bbf247e8f n=1 Tax=Sclerotinia trifoliorum TaxID=28548 RepID=A0A8H2VM48_9HELO|nr:50f5661f-7f20-4b5a-9adb-400bbf247e8f [Sclerotinia trifoliorum]